MIATVLLVEDQPDLREVLSTALIGWGYNVLATEDGRAALGILRSHPEAIDVVVSDLVLPSSSGWELARESSHLRPTTRFVIMSGYPDQPSSPFDHLSNYRFIRKPFQLRELLVIIKGILATQEEGQNRGKRNEQLLSDHDLGENAVPYIMGRLAELRADLRTCRADYHRWKLVRDEYIGIRKSIKQAMQEVSIALDQVKR